MPEPRLALYEPVAHAARRDVERWDGRSMPRISAFYGIVITMYFADHQPPHFHASYGEHVAAVTIDTLTVRAGSLPSRQLRLVRRWAELHRDELLANWRRAREREALTDIDPLP